MLASEAQLLYKAKYHWPKDEHDFGRALPRLSDVQRAWLHSALETYHPGDLWLASALTPSAGIPPLLPIMKRT